VTDRPDHRPERQQSSLWRLITEPDAYGVLLVLILASLVLTAVASESAAGRAVIVLLQGGVLLFAFWTSRTRPAVLRVAFVVVPIAVVLATVFTGGRSDRSAAVAGMTNAFLAFGAIVAIVRRIVSHPRVDAATILGVLSTYVLIGMLFASVFASAGALSGDPFFVSLSDADMVDYLYFSFVTLTTVGYGDLTAASDIGRMLAVSEALLGQLYLVSVVALVIGNIGRERPTPAPEGGGPDDAGPPRRDGSAGEVR
jgi:hypothetical protein